jgi:hypothetical protein
MSVSVCWGFIPCRARFTDDFSALVVWAHHPGPGLLQLQSAVVARLLMTSGGTTMHAVLQPSRPTFFCNKVTQSLPLLSWDIQGMLSMRIRDGCAWHQHLSRLLTSAAHQQSHTFAATQTCYFRPYGEAGGWCAHHTETRFNL